MIKIYMLPAGHGDSVWMEYGPESEPRRILIDGGVKNTYAEHIRPKLSSEIDPLHFELLVLSHIDGDHIEGLIQMLRDERMNATFGDVWFNGWHQLPADKLSPIQGIDFGKEIRDRKLPWNLAFSGNAAMIGADGDLPSYNLRDGLRLTLVSPMREDLIRLKRVWDLELRRLGLIDATRREFMSAEEGDWTDSMDIDALANSKFNKDRSKPNGSSIAFVVELAGLRVLLAGDAYAPVLRDSLNQMARERGEERLRLDAFKLSHHGSAKNLNIELLQAINCADYLFCTNGDRFHHPDHKTVARILKYGRPVAGKKIRLWFNYRSEENEIWDGADLKKRYNYETRYPENCEGQLVVIR